MLTNSLNGLRHFVQFEILEKYLSTQFLLIFYWIDTSGILLVNIQISKLVQRLESNQTPNRVCVHIG
ncbi:hypothetical protein BpHYR1_011336 [Brachionus plicatilis]|uniref:Uncharacterized protein n=1 Tax=Brachionus plicatilis TaxID=10195 RepID=A0A3M7SK43_BRAPC|nr:hypothetical protein BpHYR1_011336 [Brachionus plicatilis]